jgi:hypothetical protein
MCIWSESSWRSCGACNRTGCSHSRSPIKLYPALLTLRACDRLKPHVSWRHWMSRGGLGTCLPELAPYNPTACQAHGERAKLRQIEWKARVPVDYRALCVAGKTRWRKRRTGKAGGSHPPRGQVPRSLDQGPLRCCKHVLRPCPIRPPHRIQPTAFLSLPAMVDLDAHDLLYILAF